MAAELKVISHMCSRVCGTHTALKDTDYSALCDTNVYGHHLMSTTRRKDKDPKKKKLTRTDAKTFRRNYLMRT